MTSHYLNPVVPENYTNNGTTGDFSAQLRARLHASATVSGSSSATACRAIEIPNEQVQQAAGQRQDGDNFETMGIVSYQHVFSSNALGSLRGMVRDNSDDLTSNPESTPVIVFLHNTSRRATSTGPSRSITDGRSGRPVSNRTRCSCTKASATSITDPSQFDPGTPRPSLSPETVPTWNSLLTFRTSFVSATGRLAQDSAGTTISFW